MSDIKRISDKLFESDNEYVSKRDASLCVNAVVTGSESKETMEALATVLVQINHAPTADVAPVIRCFECERYIPPFGRDERGFCTKSHTRCYPIGYCSNGVKEVKRGGNDDETYI